MTIYDECSDAEQVDRLTTVRINRLHGNVPGDELKNLRKGLMAIISIIRPNLYPKQKRDELMAYGDKLLAMNKDIEAIIAEGNAFKKGKGWA
jgi:hypothetical protein